MDEDNGGWKEWSRFTISELRRLDKGHDNIADKLEKIDTRLGDYNQILVRNTVGLEEHIRRTNLLEAKIIHVETEMGGLNSHLNSIKAAAALVHFIFSKEFFGILKVVAVFVSLGLALHYGDLSFLKVLIPESVH